MKKKVSLTLTLFLTILIAVCGVVTVYAETIYYYFGFDYAIVNNSSVTVKGWDNSSPTVTFPEEINNRYVISVDNYAFYDNTYITDVSFVDATHLNRIGMFAFGGCTSLKNLSLSEQITNIGMGAFQNCSSLESLNYNASISYVPEQCFYNCTLLNHVDLPEYVTTIEKFAFANTALTEITLPKSVTSIDATAFIGCNDLVIKCYTDSAAHQFAVDNGYEFVLLDAPVPTEQPTEAPTEAPTQAPTAEPTQPVTEAPTQAPVAILGDVEGDGIVSTIDATVMQRYLASVAYPVGCNFAYGDVDGDGVISILDVTYIMRYLAGIDVPYPVSEPIQNQ